MTGQVVPENVGALLFHETFKLELYMGLSFISPIAIELGVLFPISRPV